MLELALRSISWLWAIHLFTDADADDREPWLVDLLLALDRQLTQVERNLSHYFSPNTHLTGEALALYVAGRTLPELAGSPRRADLGRRVLLRELDRQLAADGGHSERSTHYHRYTLDFYALALIVARDTGDDAAAWRFGEAVVALGSAARLLADDRGRLPHIGDDDGGVLTPLTGRDVDDIRDSLAVAAALVARPDFAIDRAPEEALWLLGPSAVASSAVSPPPSITASGALPATGYYISRSPAGDHLVIDGGPHGYLNAGHAHADALSLTLTARGVPLLIDPGTALLHGRSGSARSHAVDGVAQYAHARRPLAVAVQRTVPLVARRQRHGASLARRGRLRLLRRRARRLSAGHAPAPRASPCTAISSSSPITSRPPARTTQPCTGIWTRAGTRRRVRAAPCSPAARRLAIASV